MKFKYLICNAMSVSLGDGIHSIKHLVIQINAKKIINILWDNDTLYILYIILDYI